MSLVGCIIHEWLQLDTCDRKLIRLRVQGYGLLAKLVLSFKQGRTKSQTGWCAPPCIEMLADSSDIRNLSVLSGQILNFLGVTWSVGCPFAGD
jgi:hypothetical protein